MIRTGAWVPSALDPVSLARRCGLGGVGLRLGPGEGAAEASALGRDCRAAGLGLRELGVDGGAPPARVWELARAAGAAAAVVDPGAAAVGGLEGFSRECRAVLAGSGAEAAAPRLLAVPRRGSRVGSLLEASEAIRRVAHPAFGVLFDPVGLFDLDTYFDNASFVRRCVQQLGEALGGARGRDALAETEAFDFRLHEVPLGQGALDCVALLEALAALPGEVPLSVVGDSAEALEAALAHLRGVAARVGVALG